MTQELTPEPIPEPKPESEPLRINDLVAQLVAWHNRHRLARRITSEQVRAIGLVVLPFVATDPTNPAAGRLAAAFSEDFIAPLTPKQVASFALKHGSREHPGAPSWSQRMVAADAGHESSGLTLIYLRTASIELGDHRGRVLIGSGPRPKLLGPRAWSAPRIAGVSAIVTAVAAAAVLSIWLPGAGVPEHPEAAVLAAVALPSAVTTAPAAASAPSPDPAPAHLEIAEAASSPPAMPAPPPAMLAPAPASAVTTTTSAVPAPASAAPVSTTASGTLVPVDPEGATSTASDIRPLLSSDTRAAALLEARRLRAMAEAAKATEPPRIYAILTATTRIRSAAEKGHQEMDASVTTGKLPGKPRGDLMQVPEGWRAVLWPFRTRDEAKLAQMVLSKRGIRTEVIEF